MESTLSLIIEAIVIPAWLAVCPLTAAGVFFIIIMAHEAATITSQLFTFALVSCIILSGYLSLRCAMPSNPNPRHGWREDRASALVKSHKALTAGRIVCVVIYLYHAVLAVFTQNLSASCHEAARLNPRLFVWDWHTATCLFLIICIGAPLRIMAMAELETDFTIRLAAPKRLVKTGPYRYIQHPGYTGLITVMTANLAMFVRWDASPACLMPESILTKLSGYGYVTSGLFMMWTVWQGILRIGDEEFMMRETFGVEWERWHQSTKRLIPGVF